jgi:hypothetical protein
MNTSVRIVGITTEIRTEEHPNMFLVRHQYTSLFGFSDITPYFLVFSDVSVKRLASIFREDISCISYHRNVFIMIYSGLKHFLYGILFVYLSFRVLWYFGTNVSEEHTASAFWMGAFLTLVKVSRYYGLLGVALWVSKEYTVISIHIICWIMTPCSLVGTC